MLLFITGPAYPRDGGVFHQPGVYAALLGDASGLAVVHTVLAWTLVASLGAYLVLGFLVVALSLILASLYWSAGPTTSSLLQSVRLGVYGVPIGAIFWWGFALPIPLLCVVVWTLVILFSWQTLQ